MADAVGRLSVAASLTLSRPNVVRVGAAMPGINIHAARTQLSRLVDEAAAGKEVIITRAGKPVGRLVPLAPPSTAPRRVLGRLVGQPTVPADFDAPLPGDMLNAFEGR